MRDAFGRAAAEAEQRLPGALLTAGLVLEREIKLQLSHPGTGRIYKRRSISHQASAPGEPPAPDTGSLRNSIGHEAVGDVLRVGSAMAVVPEALEFGTQRIAPRPFMRPALEIARQDMTDAVVIELRRKR